jgi:2,4-dienoyl-CoA reductase (NADPH2)
VAQHRRITDAVHAEGGRILLQILHAGRYGMHERIVAPSAIKAPINRFTPAELTSAGVDETIGDFIRCARLAQAAGYNGVEIMGSEGYLLSQFLAPRTNRRADQWGGVLANRARLPIEIVRAVRAAAGRWFAIVYRISVLELIDDGLTADETAWLAAALEQGGVDAFNSGIGWHEAQIPTIAACVPPGAFARATGRLRQRVSVPVIASNRIDSPDTAERILANDQADMVSLARPHLADPDFTRKAAEGRADTIVPCIACNQACLDRYFEGRVVGCVVNPGACRESQFVPGPVIAPKRIAVVGGGPAGMAAAAVAAERGHCVTLFEANAALGGQFLLARGVPGKRGYAETGRAFAARLTAAGAELRLGQTATAAMLTAGGFDTVVVATGARPRLPDIPGIDAGNVATYAQLLTGEVVAGRRVAILGSGPIGFDVAHFLVSGTGETAETVDRFNRRWGITADRPVTPEVPSPARQVWMFKRSPGPFGRGLGKTTGWIVRRQLADAGVEQIAGVDYLGVDAHGFSYRLEGIVHHLAVDTVVLCTGQEPVAELVAELADSGILLHVIGGAADAGDLDAERAFEEGTRLGLRL